MNLEIKMPQLSETMTEGKLLQWSVVLGESVRAGDAIAEVEADKANMEIEAPEDGTIVELATQPGETVPVGTVLALFQPGTAATGQTEQKTTVAPTAASGTKASPLVQRIASQKGIALDEVIGTGSNGEILMADLEQHLASKAAR